VTWSDVYERLDKPQPALSPLGGAPGPVFAALLAQLDAENHLRNTTDGEGLKGGVFRAKLGRLESLSSLRYTAEELKIAALRRQVTAEELQVPALVQSVMKNAVKLVERRRIEP
jgi:hypothetical protein